MLDFLGVAVLIIVAGLFGWLSLRARQAKSALIKWGGTGLAVSLRHADKPDHDRRAIQAAFPQCPGPRNKRSRHT